MLLLLLSVIIYTESPKEGKKKMANWNPWHGCKKYSEGCQNCYVYRIDRAHGKDASQVFLTADFDLPMRRGRKGYLLPPGETVYTCFSSDFFLEEADLWRPRAWEMMRWRSDLRFLIITKRIARLYDCLPDDWGEGYENVHICCTVENQRQAALRLPVYREAPIRQKSIICSPLLGETDLSDYLGDWVQEVVVGGESGEQARPCCYDWVMNLRRQCVERQIPFYFMQTGARLIKDGKEYRIARKHQHAQARKAGIDFMPPDKPIPWKKNGY